jgi:hypothetical protein
MSSPHTSSRSGSQQTLADPSTIEKGPDPVHEVGEHARLHRVVSPCVVGYFLAAQPSSDRLTAHPSPSSLSLVCHARPCRGATGPFGSSAPGAGDTTGLPPPHSQREAEEEQRELDHADEVREQKHEKDWEVKFEEGDVENPMVRLTWPSVMTSRQGRTVKGLLCRGIDAEAVQDSRCLPCTPD